MDNLWSDRDAMATVNRYAMDGVNENLALRVYSTRLLGTEPRLVQHGGGNTSVKMVERDVAGDEVAVLRVKGSGWDMGTIEPSGLPAVRLDALLRLQGLPKLSDADMVNAQRGNLLDSEAPNPSVETLLHAFLPQRFIDHTHANAVLALTDQPNGEEICAKLYGDRIGLVPYVMPGFALAKLARQVFDSHAGCEGLILLKHGVFTFGDTARESYDRMIRLVNLAESRLKEGRKKVFGKAKRSKPAADIVSVAPILRGLVAVPKDRGAGTWNRLVMTHRNTPAIANFVQGRDVGRYSQAGVVTPDHVIRTKAKPLLLSAPRADDIERFRAETSAALEHYIDDYGAYFARHNAGQKPSKEPLDPMPRVVLVPGIGLFGLGKSVKEAAIAADIAETAIQVITDAEAIGRFQSIAERDIFDMEYWSLEQAKLGKASEKPLARQVAVITGGGGAIGSATAEAFAAQGSAVAVLDLDGVAAASVAGKVGGIGIACDVTQPAEVDAAFADVCKAFGGVDIVVSNAGAAWSGKIGEVADAVLRESFELNFFAHQYVAQAAVRIMLRQGTGGCLLFNVSKQAVNPGADFGPYGLPKAATLFLSRQYALDYGAQGIRSNAVNADRIRSGLLTDEMVQQRSKARGVSEKDYMTGNLLSREVVADDVAQTFVALALANKTTAAALTVDGGNIAAALR
jgi:rhamnose utilization protein RhaD (predicted bifunctional aldolase and dehydrogenase)/NAD(P)-dependent dehydrogenase (short-subunit alcohol dehydrogenase family)